MRDSRSIAAAPAAAAAAAARSRKKQRHASGINVKCDETRAGRSEAGTRPKQDVRTARCSLFPQGTTAQLLPHLVPRLLRPPKRICCQRHNVFTVVVTFRVVGGINEASVLSLIASCFQVLLSGRSRRKRQRLSFFYTTRRLPPTPGDTPVAPPSIASHNTTYC